MLATLVLATISYCLPGSGCNTPVAQVMAEEQCRKYTRELIPKFQSRFPEATFRGNCVRKSQLSPAQRALSAWPGEASSTDALAYAPVGGGLDVKRIMPMDQCRVHPVTLQAPNAECIPLSTMSPQELAHYGFEVN